MRSLAVALLLLLTVSTASAECAWVLWYQQGVGRFLMSESFKTFEKCKERQETINDAIIKEINKGDTRRLEQGAICHPDTVDPRGPRGSEGKR